jgi:DNA uptake protein ComE-like DNA-binding protein
MKKPAGVGRRRALVSVLDLSGRLLQAMAVRRHGGPMMMMTEMAVALHLLQSYGQTPSRVNFSLRRTSRQAENGAVRPRIRWAALTVTLLGVCVAVAGQNQDRDTRGVPKTSANAPAPEARIDINHATVDELLKVPGMTASWAGRIVRFRPYHTKDDLLERGVVTSTVYDRIKDYVIAHRDKQ